MSSEWYISAAVVAVVYCVAIQVGPAQADPVDQELRMRFDEVVRPFLETYCRTCHAGQKAEGKLDLSAYKSAADVAGGDRAWKAVLGRLSAGEMPPEEEQQPTAEQRQMVIEWIRAFRKRESLRHAGDPGLVPARRLSNAEYNYTIRDLTGVDIRPAREFPVDPANEAGFDNSAESLSMSPALLRKYLGAARSVVEHLVLKPDGFDFAPHPVVTNTDRDKYCVKRIVQFYERQPTDYADYFYSAWRFRNRKTLGTPEATLADVAEDEHVSAKYLAAIWSLLTEPAEDVGPIAKLQTMWQALPSRAARGSDARQGCETMRDYVVELRRQLEPQVENLRAEGIHTGSQPFVLWKNRQYAAHRRSYDRAALKLENESDPDEETHLDLILRGEADRRRYEAALERFCENFPDAFYVSERGRDYLGKPKDEQEKGRLLSAGFHSMMGYFRDDGPLYELILTEDEQRELDGLWQELDFITSAPMRQYSGFLWFERTDSRYMRDPEFDFARPEDKAASTEAMIDRLSDVYLRKARRNGAGEVELQAIIDYFHNINEQIRWVDSTRRAAEPSHRQALADFAARAYRKALSEAETEDLLGFYHALRQEQGLSHEEAIQDAVVSVLMSPRFCFRIDLAGTSEGTQPRSDDDLASRLSYFLWSSMPDRELLDVAAAGELHRAEVLFKQAHRMLRDQRIAGLATEFGGNWLDFRRFDEHNAVDRERFPEFTGELRQAMFAEPIRFFIDLVQQDRTVLEFLEADYSFVNSVLARHYGMSDVAFEADEWKRVDGVGKYHRGGLLPMSVFLTKNAPGLRTSPVKRGYWVVRRLLGEEIPPPPPDVPELPRDERGLGELTLAETLARHRDHASCAGCHDRFDSIGLVFENYGPIGEWRDVDLGGRPVSSDATFPGGSRGSGLGGLRRYLRDHRQEEFLDNLCRKLLSYALGRTLMLSDEPLIEEMQLKLKRDGYRFSSLVESIVTSPQFLNRRGDDPLVKE